MTKFEAKWIKQPRLPFPHTSETMHEEGRVVYHVGPGENINHITDPKKKRLSSQGSNAATSTGGETADGELQPGEVGPTGYRTLPGVDGSLFKGYTTEVEWYIE